MLSHLESKLKEDKFIVLKSDLQRQQNVFTVANKSSEAAVYANLQIIAKRSRPFTDCELMKERILTATEILCPEKHQLLTISLSANTVADRVNNLVGNVQC